LLALGIDLAESGEHIHTVGHVAWSDPTGKTGIRFPKIAEALRLQLRHWLAANARTEAAPASEQASQLAVWEKIEKELERCGGDVEAALHLIAQHALTLTSASGAAIALLDPLNRAEMICRARVGTDSPDMGARLNAGAGFSGQCVTAAVTLKCDDSESDSRVDRESCGRLGIRSIVACPVKHDREVMGILEVFSAKPAAFGANDIAALDRLAGFLEHATGRPEDKPAAMLRFPASDEAPENLSGTAAMSFDEPKPEEPPSSWRRGILLLLIALVFVGGTVWIGARWMAARSSQISSVAPASPAEAAVPRETYIGADPKDLQVHADAGDAAAEYRLGMRYATGEDMKQDYGEAMHWFLRAADQGDVHAQATVAVWMMAGRGAPQDYGQAYYWALLAQAGGDEAGRAIVVNSAPYLSPVQTAAAQKHAEDWLHSHHIGQAPTESTQ
jgi:GAF domain/Sel1 repeat